MNDDVNGSKRSTKRITDPKGFAIMYARQWRFDQYLTFEEIEEEAGLVKLAYDILELVPTVSLFRDLLGCRFRKRMKDKGYRWLSVHSKEVRVYGAKPGWVKVL